MSYRFTDGLLDNYGLTNSSRPFSDGVTACKKEMQTTGPCFTLRNGLKG